MIERPATHDEWRGAFAILSYARSIASGQQVHCIWTASTMLSDNWSIAFELLEQCSTGPGDMLYEFRRHALQIREKCFWQTKPLYSLFHLFGIKKKFNISFCISLTYSYPWLSPKILPFGNTI